MKAHPINILWWAYYGMCSCSVSTVHSYTVLGSIGFCTPPHGCLPTLKNLYSVHILCTAAAHIHSVNVVSSVCRRLSTIKCYCEWNSSPVSGIWSWNLHQLKEHNLPVQKVCISMNYHKQSLSGAPCNRGIVWPPPVLIIKYISYRSIIDHWDDLCIVLKVNTLLLVCTHCVLPLDDACVWLIILNIWALSIEQSSCRTWQKINLGLKTPNLCASGSQYCAAPAHTLHCELRSSLDHTPRWLTEHVHSICLGGR